MLSNAGQDATTQFEDVNHPPAALKMLDDYYVHPSDENSTELGEVPQAAEKGAIKPGYNYEPYWMSYMLEEQKKG